MSDEDTNPRAPVARQPAPQPRRRFAQPVGRTAAFVEAVRAGKGEAFVASWLSSRTCQFEDCVIWTHDLGRDKLNFLTGALIREHRIVIKSDEESRAHFRAQTDGAHAKT